MARPLTIIAATETAQSASSTACTVVGLELSSTADAVTYVKLYDATGAPNVATTEPLCFFHAPIGARSVPVPPLAIAHGLWVACSEEPDAGATAPSAAVSVQVWVA